MGHFSDTGNDSYSCTHIRLQPILVHVYCLETKRRCMCSTGAQYVRTCTPLFDVLAITGCFVVKCFFVVRYALTKRFTRIGGISAREYVHLYTHLSTSLRLCSFIARKASYSYYHHRPPIARFTGLTDPCAAFSF